MSSKQQTKRKEDLIKAFRSAKSTNSVDEMLKIFKQMETCFKESELGISSWMLAQQLCRNSRDPEQILKLGKRALQIFLTNKDNDLGCSGTRGNPMLVDIINTGVVCTYKNHKSDVSIASLLSLLACASMNLKRFDESLCYLNWGNRNLTKMLEDKDESGCNASCVLHVLDGNQVMMFHLKKKLRGKREETIVHARKHLEILEKTMEDGCLLLGHAYNMVCDAYWMDRNFEESVPFGLKAVEIFTKYVEGDDSLEEELVKVRRNLGACYGVLGEDDKSIEQARLSMICLKSNEFGSHSDWVSAHMEVANRLLALGRNQEGIEAFAFLNLFAADTESEEQVKARSFTCMARGYCNMEKFPDARKHMKMAQKIFEKKRDRISPMVAATVFEEMSKVYEDMKEYDSAVLYLWKSVAIPELPEKNLIASSSRLLSLISVAGKVKKGTPYLHEVLERLKGRLCPDHREVGHGYIHLGMAYLKSEQVKLAVKFFEKGKDTMEATVGLHHVDSVRASQILSVSYEGIGRYHSAIKVQKKTVSRLKSKETIASFESMPPNISKAYSTVLAEAIMHLNQLKDRVVDPTWSEPQSEDVDELSAAISKCKISVDGKVK